MFRTIVKLFDNGAKSGDLADKLNYRCSFLLLIFCSALLAVDQWVEEPIQCLVPDTFPSSWERYSAKHCYLENQLWRTHRSESEVERTNESKKHALRYKWVPLMLLLRATLFYLPWILWSFAGSRAILSLVDLVSTADMQNKDYVQQIAGRFGTRKAFKPNIGSKPERKIWTNIDKAWQTGLAKIDIALQILLIVGGCLGPLFYLILKVLFLINLHYQLKQLTTDLGQTNTTSYPWAVIANVTAGLPYERNDTQLPTTVLCDMQVRVKGNIQRYTIECLLPIHDLMERVFIGLLLWLQFVSLATLLSFLYWLFVTVFLPVNVLLVNGYLKGAKPYAVSLTTLIKFTYCFLAPDGVFLLRLLKAKDAQQLIGPLWDRFEKDQQVESFEVDPDEAENPESRLITSLQ